MMRRHIEHMVFSLLLVMAAASSCKRVPLYDASSGIYLELELKLNLDMTVSDTIDLGANPQYYNKVHLTAPSRLAACFYDVNTHQMVAKEYVGPTGGYIQSVPAGTYDIMVYELGTLVTRTASDDVRGQLRAHTNDISQSVTGVFRSSTSDPVISEPDHLLVARKADVVIPDHADIDETIVIHADGKSIVETYSFIVKNITGIENLSSVQALITGQASSRFLWDGHNPTAPVGLLTTSVADRTRKCLYGVYNTFGQIAGQVILNILVTTTTGEELVYPVDITDQVTDPDNTDHKITVTDTIKIIPQGGSSQEGYSPTVNEWDPEVIDIPID